MRVMIIGSGGREHALGWKIAQSPYVTGVLYVGGNAGTAKESKSLGNVQAVTFEQIHQLIMDHKIDLVIPGSEGLLSIGLVNHLHACDYYNVFGPTAEAARIESDKFFSYSLMTATGIPQASSILCHTKQHILDAIELISSEGIVLKARGLTGGKGVSVFATKAEASAGVDEFILKYGSELLVSERLVGQEFSVFALCNGEQVVPFPFLIQDYKRLQDGDQGPNTGGMGSHTIMLDYPSLIETVAGSIMRPAIQELARLGCPYKGFLYAGMMLLPNNELRVLEFNCRFGDPECQVAMVMMYDDLLQSIQDALMGVPRSLSQYPGSACCAVLTTKDYPADTLRLGMPITIPEIDPTVKIFHAGTVEDEVAGGRVLNVVSYANDLPSACRSVYSEVAKIAACNSDLFHYRTDIGGKYAGIY